MTDAHEDALYEFLDNVAGPFSLEEISASVRMAEPKNHGRLNAEVSEFIDSRRLAFPLDAKHWISRRGFFERLQFVIKPSRTELLNGILIPGHRFVPFANPMLLPHEYHFSWNGKAVPGTTTEGPPEDLYPYYILFGEEYAPQYVARDNPENEAAYNEEPYDDPPEVSIHTLDMRGLYRETAFVPGDLLLVSTRSWKEGAFEFDKISRNAFREEELAGWLAAAEDGFAKSFELLGPGASTEEQIAFAYWFGGERMRRLPAYSLEEFIYEKTERIETVPYGIETRFWFAGKDIPDRRELEGIHTFPNRTLVEEILFRAGVPVSEFVIQAFIRDALYRGEKDGGRVLSRLIPEPVEVIGRDRQYLAFYISEVFREFAASYSRFADARPGSIRTRIGELHTAVVEIAAQLQRYGTGMSWLPRHTFVVLSQIQGHAALVLEDLIGEEAIPPEELEAMDNSVDSMIDTYEDLKEMVNEALETFRKNNIALYTQGDGNSWRTVQISLGGTEIWRRLVLPENFTLGELKALIQSLFGWNIQNGVFTAEKGRTPGPLRRGGREENPVFSDSQTVGELGGLRTSELLCEFGTNWTVKVIILARYQARPGEGIRCVAGEGAAPPRFIDGPLRFRRFISALERGNDRERRLAQSELGRDYDPEKFDIDSCNRALRGASERRGGGLSS